MARVILSLLLVLLTSLSVAAQGSSDPVAQALAQGDLYQSKRKYELALDAYHKADKLSHHSSAASYLKLSLVERKLGDFSSALDDAKRALKVAGDNKTAALQARLVRATLLTQMAGKPTDKKLKEAEDELRQALALDSTNAIAHLDLGMVLLRQERDAEGIPELNAFVSSPNADSRSVAEARLVIANPIRARTPFAPHFSFTTHENQNVSNASLRGKVVLLDFWGTWCPPCRESVPILRDLNKKYAGKSFQLVGISSDNDEEVWKTFIQAQHMDWSEYIDLSDEVLQAFKVESFPTYIVLDKDGVIRFRQSGLGEYTQGELTDAIKKALKRESDPKLAAAAAAEEPPVSASNVSSAAPSSGDGGKPATNSSTSLLGIEASSISGNVYKNEALSMSYEFPRGWIAAKPESLHVLNERSEAGAKAAVLQQHPELADSLRFSTPKIVFYASRKGDGDGQRLGLPSLRISVTPSRLDSLHLSTFQQMMDHMAVASGLKLFAQASEYTVNKHQFLRADFERSSGGPHGYQSYVQTLSEDYLLTIEVFASSPDELQQVAASLQSMSISEENP
jgi:thiol-disulfide isomerase/thioredoxin